MTEIQASGQVVAAKVDDTATGPTGDASGRPADEDADFAELPPRRRVPALTKVLIVGVLVALSFGAGVLVQKQHDASLTSAVPAFPSGAGGIPAFLSGAGAPGTGASSGGSSSAAVSGPVLIGTVESVSGGDITVKDFGGAAHIVHTTAATGLATTGADWPTSLPSGTIVSIEGTKADDGTVSATTITRR